MIAQHTPGSILLVASVASRHVLFPLHQSAHSVSKAGVLQLTTTLAAEWAEYGIRVNSISPGVMRTPMTSYERVKPGVQAWVGRTPLGRIGEPDELFNTQQGVSITDIKRSTLSYQRHLLATRR